MSKFKKGFSRKIEDLEAAYFDGTKECVDKLSEQLGDKIVGGSSEGRKLQSLVVKNLAGERLNVLPNTWLVKEVLDEETGEFDLEVFGDDEFDGLFTKPKGSESKKKDSKDDPKKEDPKKEDPKEPAKK